MIMGLFKKNPKYKILVLFKKFLVAYLFNNSENIYFLGLEEFNFAKNNYKKLLDKLRDHTYSFEDKMNSSYNELITKLINEKK